MNSIKKRENDFIKYILPQKNNADIIVNFYTNDTISFTDLERNYEIKLNIFIKKKYNITFLLLDTNNFLIQNKEKYYKINVINPKENFYNTIKYVIKNLNNK